MVDPDLLTGNGYVCHKLNFNICSVDPTAYKLRSLVIFPDSLWLVFLITGLKVIKTQT